MKTTLYIQNLKCGGCEATILNKLSRMHGVKNVRISHDTNSVSFDHDADSDIELVQRVLSKLGYPVIDEENSFTKKAKSYVSCATGRLKK